VQRRARLRRRQERLPERAPKGVPLAAVGIGEALLLGLLLEVHAALCSLPRIAHEGLHTSVESRVDLRAVATAGPLPVDGRGRPA
jgi:hypothetical protein